MSFSRSGSAISLSRVLATGPVGADGTDGPGAGSTIESVDHIITPYDVTYIPPYIYRVLVLDDTFFHASGYWYDFYLVTVDGMTELEMVYDPNTNHFYHMVGVVDGAFGFETDSNPVGYRLRVFRAPTVPWP